jgi:hypothetical protein
MSSPNFNDEAHMPMNTNGPFGTQVRPDLALKRRAHPIARPMESDNTVPFEGEDLAHRGQSALQAAWEKLYKARSILEAEQVHLRDDRIALQGEIEQLQRREENVAAHELRLHQIEQQAQLQIEEEQDARSTASPLAKLSRVPFDVARSVFGPKK